MCQFAEQFVSPACRAAVIALRTWGGGGGLANGSSLTVYAGSLRRGKTDCRRIPYYGIDFLLQSVQN
jgi:hypothetical protein